MIESFDPQKTDCTLIQSIESDSNPDPLDLIIQGVTHILPGLMTITGLIILGTYLYGDLT